MTVMAFLMLLVFASFINSRLCLSIYDILADVFAVDDCVISILDLLFNSRFHPQIVSLQGCMK